MDDEIHIVEQHPLRLLVTLGMGDAEAQGLEALVDGIGDSLDLALIRAAAHHKEVSECSGLLFEFEDRDVVRLFVLAGENRLIYLVFEVVRFLHSWLLDCNLPVPDIDCLPRKEQARTWDTVVRLFIQAVFFYVVGNLRFQPTRQGFALRGRGSDDGGGGVLVDAFQQVQRDSGEDEIAGCRLLVKWTGHSSGRAQIFRQRFGYVAQ